MTGSQSPVSGAAVRYEADGPVATLTLDTPHNRNAISRALLTGLHDGLAALLWFRLLWTVSIWLLSGATVLVLWRELRRLSVEHN